MFITPTMPRTVAAMPVAPSTLRSLRSAAELARIEGERATNAMLAATSAPVLADAPAAGDGNDPAMATRLDATRQRVPTSSSQNTEEEAADCKILEAHWTVEPDKEAGWRR
ncbi:hypothetical protein MKK84_00390 [Methylobacterium sp. E-065]|uniref:hypothetical protein n=1 Tax=Methylobacterium sp. E-065 TaxID=2836583 RepID=UPI001FBAA0C6|nr:hypothetical protein [Methylobacterium sp. E-065]MCJ2015899.1 hypothetical protein [Methylobacterium sp. E-065]